MDRCNQTALEDELTSPDHGFKILGLREHSVTHAQSNDLGLGALAGLKVVELGGGVAGAMCGKWLAAFGATVIKVEPPGGDWTRRYSASGARANVRSVGSLFRYLSPGKQSLQLDAASEKEQDRLTGMLRATDLIVRNVPSGPLLGSVAVAAARESSPKLVDLQISPFGFSGPYSAFLSSPIVTQALGGWQFILGDPDREPLSFPGFQSEYLIGLFALTAGMSAVVRARESGRSSTVEVNGMEVMSTLHQFTISQLVNQGTIRQRSGGRSRGNPLSKLLPCRDGFVGMCCVTEEHWHSLCLMLGMPEYLEDPRFGSFADRNKHATELEEILVERLAPLGKQDFFEEGQQTWRLPVGPSYDLPEVMDDPHLRAREFWVHPDGEPDQLEYPGLPVKFSATHWRFLPSPRLDEHGELATKSVIADPPANSRLSKQDGPLPLAGLRVLDLTRIWSGPLCCRILADLGAEVIRIDSPQQRINVDASVNARVAARGGFGSVKHNRNKQSVTIDLAREAGRALFKRMVARADVVVENFSARVMPNFGLDYAALREFNPRLVMMLMPGYGSSGPYKDYPAYGPSLEPLVGLPNIVGYPDRGPSSSGIAYTDCVAGVTGAAALMIAVSHQRETGHGQVIDLSQVEATINLFGEYFLEYQATGALIPRFGNRSPVWSPQGTYRCQGDDEWLSLTVLTDEQWRSLTGIPGLEGLARPEFNTQQGRAQNLDAIDAALSQWTASKTKFEAMSLLQHAGIAAGAVLNAKDMLENPHLKFGGFFVEGRLAEGDTMMMPGTPVRIDGRKRDAWTAAPLPGEHNREVLMRILNLSEPEFEAIEASGALGQTTTQSASQ